MHTDAATCDQIPWGILFCQSQCPHSSDAAVQRIWPCMTPKTLSFICKILNQKWNEWMRMNYDKWRSVRSTHENWLGFMQAKFGVNPYNNILHVSIQCVIATFSHIFFCRCLLGQKMETTEKTAERKTKMFRVLFSLCFFHADSPKNVYYIHFIHFETFA